MAVAAAVALAVTVVAVAVPTLRKSSHPIIGVRDFPARDISSLGALGLGG